MPRFLLYGIGAGTAVALIAAGYFFVIKQKEGPVFVLPEIPGEPQAVNSSAPSLPEIPVSLPEPAVAAPPFSEAPSPPAIKEEPKPEPKPSVPLQPLTKPKEEIKPAEKPAAELAPPAAVTPPSSDVPVKPLRKPKIHEVYMVNNKFNPQTLTVYVGDTVRWINLDKNLHWPSADPHPTHTALPDFDPLGDLGQGESYSYTFRKAEAVPYHDHTEANIVAGRETITGIITVIEE